MALLTFAVSILWILVTSTTLLYLEYRLNKNAVMEQLMEVGEINAPNLSRSIWEYERALLETQLKEIIQLPSISYTRLEETDGTILEFGNTSNSYPQEITFKIDFDDRGEIINLGLLKIYPDLVPLHQNLKSLAIKIVSIQTMNAFVIAIIIFVLFHFFAGRHLTDITAQAAGLSADHLDSPIRLKRKTNLNENENGDELDILETALNDMRIHLINAFSELKISEERHRKLFETMRQGVIYQGLDGNILSINPAASRMFGLDEKRLVSMNHYDAHWNFFCEDGTPVSPEAQPGIRALTTGKTIMDEVLRIYNPSKKTHRWLKINAVPLIREGEAVPYQVHLTFDDITRRKQAQEQIDRYVHIISSTNDMMSFIDRQYIYRAVNDSYLNYHGKKYEEIIGFSIPALMGSKTFESVVKPYFNRALGGETINFQKWFTYPEVGKRYMNVTYSPFHKEDDKVDGVVVSVNDLTEIKLAENEIRDLRNYLSNIINSMPSTIIGVDQGGIVTQWNMTTERKTGILAKSAVGKPLIDLIPQMASEMDKVTESIRTGNVVQNPKRPCSMTEKECFEEMTIYPLVADGVNGAVIRIDDITEKVQMEEMMVQSEKMLSVGGLAAGMAHEINNPLAAMLQTAVVMKSRLQQVEMKANLKAANDIGVSMEHIKEYMEQRDIFKMIDTINESGMRVKKIVVNMLSFARKPEAIVSTFQLAQLMDETLTLAATDYDLKKQHDFKNIKIIREYDNNLPMLPCETSKIQQVLLNIFKNGAQAMQNHAFSNNDIPCFHIKLAAENEAKMIRIEIEDNGPGMDNETRKKIFEPFFTTKPVGEGTGLGLSVSYFIVVENHGGSMDVISTPGKGTTFIIRLPF